MRMSLRTRYVLEMTIVMGIAFFVFSVAVFGTVAVHIFLSARTEAFGIANATAESLLERGPQIGSQELDRALQEFAASAGTHIFVYTPSGQLLTQMPEGIQAPKMPGVSGLVLGSHPMERAVVVTSTGTVATELPLTPFLDLMKDLALSLVVLLSVAILVVGLLARRTVARVLNPVDGLTRRAREMQRTGEVGPFFERSGAPDEFTRLADVLSNLISDLEERRLRDRRLLAEAAHELRTPLQIVKGNLAFMRPEADVDEGTRRDSMASIERAVVRISKLTEDILFLEQASEPPREQETFGVVDLLEEIVEDAEAGLPGRHVVLVPPQEGLSVTTERMKLTRLLWILLENALKYSPEAGNVFLRARRSQGGVAIEVMDEGPGIPTEDLPRVFDRFYRGKGQRQSEGTGLGLAIARALAASLGARLRLENRKEGGLLATLTLPVNASKAGGA